MIDLAGLSFVLQTGRQLLHQSIVLIGECLKQRLVNMFVAQEASLVFKFTNYSG